MLAFILTESFQEIDNSGFIEQVIYDVKSNNVCIPESFITNNYHYFFLLKLPLWTQLIKNLLTLDKY